jgi:hypothetical protein
MTKNVAVLRVALGALLLLGPVPAFAQADPPSRVGRLSYMEGTVSFHTADQGQWSPATLNYPVVAGESFWTEPQSRAEIQVGSAEIRIDETAALDIVALDDRSTRLQLDQGVVNVHLRAAPRSPMQVMTPYGEVDIMAAGSYHIDAGHPEGDAPPPRIEVTTLEGQAEMVGPRSRVQILAGESAFVGGNPVSFTLAEGNSTPFDDWALQRERREEAFAAAQYVSPEATGYQDLDDYGRWSGDPTYGNVWYPTAVAADWAPYRYGHWAWVPPWGWTWIDDAPWGFAPFHYGRWVEIEGRWGWCPGERLVRPVYAPALVAFIGGGGFGVTIASGAVPAVGWVPLAPFEVYHPYYHTSVAYVRNVNVTNVNRTVINNITNVTYVNQTTVVNNYHNHQAATVVPQAAFTHAAPVHQATLVVPHDQLAQVRAAPTVEHLKPTAVARAGVAIPVAAAAPMVRPNTPASLARTPIREEPSQATRAEPAVPTAPGPANAHPGAHGAPAMAHLPPGQVQRQENTPATAHLPPGQVQRQENTPAMAHLPPGQVQRQENTPARPNTPAPQPPPAVASPLAPQPPRVEVPGVAHDQARKVPPPPSNVTIVRPPAATPQPQPAAREAARTPAATPQPQPPAREAARTPTAAPPPVAAAPARPPAVAAAQRPPFAPVDRPAQQSHPAPTPQGWVRAPGPPPAPPARAPTPAAASHAAPAPAHGAPPPQNKKGDEHKPGG